MCFGNPYGDVWNLDIINHWIYKLKDMGVKIISLSDTIGSSTPQSIKSINTIEYPTLAIRPAYSVLDCAKIKSYFGINASDWRIGVDKVVKKVM